MTIEERFERIEHYTAGIAQERRRDREEYRQLWRDTQRQINELTLKIADTNDAIARMASDTNEAIAQFVKESREADARLGARIDALVSAIGSKLLPPQN